MTPHLRPMDLPLETQAAEGLPRRCWSVAKIAAMIRARFTDIDERFEPSGGTDAPMSPKGVGAAGYDEIAEYPAAAALQSFAEIGVEPAADAAR